MLAAQGIHAFGVLKGIDLDVAPGEALAILGPSNSGKSLLLKILAGLRTPDRGSIFLEDKEVTGRPCREIGMTFQQGGLFDSWSVGENLRFAQEETREEGMIPISQALSEVGLSGTEALAIAELSGGMQKRLGLARAFSLCPKVLLLDEPTAGLDPLTARSILSLIQKMKSQYGMALILVTSDPAQAEYLCKEMIFLSEGVVRQRGKLAALRTSGFPDVVQFLSGSEEGPL